MRSVDFLERTVVTLLNQFIGHAGICQVIFGELVAIGTQLILVLRPVLKAKFVRLVDFEFVSDEQLEVLIEVFLRFIFYQIEILFVNPGKLVGVIGFSVNRKKNFFLTALAKGHRSNQDQRRQPLFHCHLCRIGICFNNQQK